MHGERVCMVKGMCMVEGHACQMRACVAKGAAHGEGTSLAKAGCVW